MVFSETPITPNEIFSLLSCKNGMNDDRYFVKRKELMAKLIGDISSSLHTSVWIYGPRRIGKTSIANAMFRFCKENNYFCLYIDAIDLYKNGFQTLIEKTVELASTTVFLPGKDYKKKFESLAKLSNTRPVLLIIDEFDKIALNMDEVDQAFFRRLDSEFNKFSFLFISYQSPTDIVEEVEVNSRLLGVCDTQKIKQFNRLEVKSLFKKVKTDLGNNDFDSCAEHVFNCIGGFPVAVIAACKELAVACHHREGLTDDDILDILEDIKNNLEVDIRSYWNYLNPFTKSVLLGQSDSSGYDSFLKEDGLFVRGKGVIRPRFLIEIGEKKKSFVAKYDNKNDPDVIYQTAINIFQIVSEINRSLHLKKFPDGFKIDNISIQMHRLCKQPCSEDILEDSVSYMYQVFFEGAKTDNGEKRYRLPNPFGDIYKKSEVVGDISNLRNFFSHNQTRSSDTEKPNKYYKKASKIFKRRCGEEEPFTDELRTKIRTSLLRDLQEILLTIHKGIQRHEITE